MKSLCVQTDNRAVSALFRVFGGVDGGCHAEACQHTGFQCMHRMERFLLSIWIPLSVLVAAADFLVVQLGLVPGILLAVPAGFLALNLLPWVLPAGKPLAQWHLWLLTFAIWAFFHLNAGGFAGYFAWGWIALLAANSLAFLLLALRSSMGIKGTLGIVWRLFLFVALHIAAIGVGWRWGWPWALASGAGIAALYCLVVLCPGCQWLGPVTCSTGDRSIRITIDDGPDPETTLGVLDLLDQYGVKAVFFMIGSKVAAHPDLAREIIRRGHEIGNHTMNHPQASFWCAGPWRTRREIAECQRLIGEVTGSAPRWFRAPVGHRNLFTHPVAAVLGLKVMAWNRRGYDAVETDAAKVLVRILPDLGPGDIVLLHEATPIATKVLAGVLDAVAREPTSSPSC